MIRERTMAGVASARAQGRFGGRRPKLQEGQRAEILDMVSSGRRTASQAAQLFDVHPATISSLPRQTIS
jgi:DNA invertase Pin-like site-specific DNA recombinase